MCLSLFRERFLSLSFRVTFTSSFPLPNQLQRGVGPVSRALMSLPVSFYYAIRTLLSNGKNKTETSCW